MREDFITTTYAAAKESGHIFPDYATCEAALESSFGSSKLSILGHNLFGMKQHTHPIFGTMILPTHEYLDGKWVAEDDKWVNYPDIKTCFADRMSTIKRLATMYPHYAAALNAVNGVVFIVQVSQTWSTDPRRAQKVLQIYDLYRRLFPEDSDVPAPAATPAPPASALTAAAGTGTPAPATPDAPTTTPPEEDGA